MSRREPVSIVCVYNDAEVLADCLARSVTCGLESAPDTELIAVDNTTNAFETAGGALGHGATQARHEVVAFVHQDVVLHSLVALEEAAGLMADRREIGLLGACGIAPDGSIHGRIRDRVVLIGKGIDQAVDVDSLDEVLFMARRADLADEPLSCHPDLAWHAYAVEYGLRQRSLGKRVVAAQIPITHNSLTTNLDRLDVAHQRLAVWYPNVLPVRTTVGRLPPRTSRFDAIRRPDGRRSRLSLRWLRESVMAHRGVHQVRKSVAILTDIRLDVDDLMAQGETFTVLNVDVGWFTPTSNVTVRRLGNQICLTAGSIEDAKATLAARQLDQSLLVTNLNYEDLSRLPVEVGGPSPILGNHLEMGYWVLVGPAAERRTAVWAHPRSVPAHFPGFG